MRIGFFSIFLVSLVHLAPSSLAQTDGAIQIAEQTETATLLQAASDAAAEGDIETANAIWSRLAEIGIPEAQAELGVSLLYGLGVEQDATEAMRWFRLAQSQGSSFASYCLGMMSELGLGTPVDHFEAYRLFSLAAADGDARAQYFVGWLLAAGVIGPADYVAAADWYGLAAGQGLAVAQFALGELYREGRGVAQDLTEGARLLGLAAEQGYSPAQSSLASLYRYGEGVPRDDRQALKWFLLSLPGSNEEQRPWTERSLAALEARMTLAETEWAHRAAERCRDTGYADCPIP